MDVLASIMTFLREYDYLLFPLIVASIAGFTSDKWDKILLWSLSIIYCMDAMLGSTLFCDVSTFYQFNIFINAWVMLILCFVKPLWKQILTQCACLFIIGMNYIEHASPYQTGFYPYIDSIHSWYLELLILIIMVKFKIIKGT